MISEKKHQFNSKIADIKTKSIAQVAVKFAHTMAVGKVQTLPGAPITLPQRVTK